MRVYGRPPIWPRRSGSWTRSGSSCARRYRAADRRALPQQCAEPGHRIGPCSTPACPTACTAAPRFFERAPRSGALAYLRLLENPHDDTSFMRVVNFRRAAWALHAGAATGPAARGGAARCARRGERRARQRGGARTWSAFIGHGGCDAKGRPGPEPARAIIGRVLESAACWNTTATRRRARTGWRTGQAHPARPSLLNHPGASAATPWPCRSAKNERSAHAKPASQGLDPNRPLLQQPWWTPTRAGRSALAAFFTHAALEAGDNQARPGRTRCSS